MPNSPRDAPQGDRIPQRILLGGSNIARLFCVGVPKTGEAKFPMTPATNIKIGFTKFTQLHVVPHGAILVSKFNNILTTCDVSFGAQISRRGTYFGVQISCRGTYFAVQIPRGANFLKGYKFP